MKANHSDGGNFQRPKPGTHVARCVRIIDLGTQENDYQGLVTYKRQMVIGWELPNALIPEGDYAGQPFMAHKFYTTSMHEKANLRIDLTNWRGDPFTDEEADDFEIDGMMSQPCMVVVTEYKPGKQKITAVTALPEGYPAPKQFNDSFIFSLEDGEFDLAKFDALSDGFKKMVIRSPEYKKLTGQVEQPPKQSPQDEPAPRDDFRDIDFGNDDIPF
jgi:hypothetical protein